MPWVLAIVAILAGLGGWTAGSKYVRGQWAEADNAALEAQIDATARAIAERNALQTQVAAIERQLVGAELAASDWEIRYREALNREPIIRTETRTVEVPGDCPDITIECPVIDARAHVRLWNNALAGILAAADPAAAASGGCNAALRRPGTPAGVPCRE